MNNLEEYKICKADSKEWARYHAIYRLSNFNEWMSLSFQGDIDRYLKVDFCYWVMVGGIKAGGALIKPNMLKCIFTIPPFNNKEILINKLSKYVETISDKSKPIEVPDADLESVKYYQYIGYKLGEVNKLMVCPTNKYEVTWDEQYEIISPDESRHAADMAELYFQSYSKNKLPQIAAQSYEFQVSSVNVCFNFINGGSVPKDWSTLVLDKLTNKLVAACTVALVNNLPYILDFVVHPEYQRRGLATKMMQRTLNLFKNEYPAIRLNITVGNDAEILYNKLGFISLAETALMKKEWHNEKIN